MEDRTIGIIYEVKHHPEIPAREALINYMMRYSGGDSEIYTDSAICRIAKYIFSDYCHTSTNCSVEVYNLLTRMEAGQDMVDAILNTLACVRVRDSQGNYIDGFREIEYA